MVLVTPYVLLKYRNLVISVQWLLVCTALITLIVLGSKEIIAPGWVRASYDAVVGFMLISMSIPALNPPPLTRFPKGMRWACG